MPDMGSVGGFHPQIGQKKTDNPLLKQALQKVKNTTQQLKPPNISPKVKSMMKSLHPQKITSEISDGIDSQDEILHAQKNLESLLGLSKSIKEKIKQLKEMLENKKLTNSEKTKLHIKLEKLQKLMVMFTDLSGGKDSMGVKTELLNVMKFLNNPEILKKLINRLILEGSNFGQLDFETLLEELGVLLYTIQDYYKRKVKIKKQLPCFGKLLKNKDCLECDIRKNCKEAYFKSKLE